MQTDPVQSTNGRKRNKLKRYPQKADRLRKQKKSNTDMKRQWKVSGNRMWGKKATFYLLANKNKNKNAKLKLHVTEIDPRPLTDAQNTFFPFFLPFVNLLLSLFLFSN